MIAFLFFLLFHTGEGAASSPIPPACRQLVLVVTPSYEATGGNLFEFQRSAATAPWQVVAGAIPVVVGRAGLGWGEGLHQHVPGNRPVKHEGDGRSPAGVFKLSSAFGFPRPEELSGLHFPYVQITEALECVDDGASQYYNTLTNRSNIQNDWQSSEKMFEIKADYRLGVFVDHNTHPRRAGKGSCIFLHVASTPPTPTAGCTAMADAEMTKLIIWLNEEAQPALVQLPQAEYDHLRRSWQLPEIPAAASE